MRQTIEKQLKLGNNGIENVIFDTNTRDEIPKLLMGLQYIYCTPLVREKVFKILEDMIPKNIDTNKGRPGMELWKILVLGTLRLNCNWDYDKLREIVNHHDTIRQMLGHGIEDKEKKYGLETIRENISLLTLEILIRINEVVVSEGHKVVKHQEGDDLKARCDSFVVETDVHHPTDINLLFDSLRKSVESTAKLADKHKYFINMDSKKIIAEVKKLFRIAQKTKRSNSKKPEKKAARDELIKQVHENYIIFVQGVLLNIKIFLNTIGKYHKLIDDIKFFMNHAERQIDQIRRRVINGEVIPHNEKVFSIFEEYTEWISKGKAGVPQELGLKVAIIEDKYGFLLNHMVMQSTTDDQIAVSFIENTQQIFQNLRSCSFDKGFWSPDNKEKLNKILDQVILPKKGKLSGKDKEVEYSRDFIARRYKHSAVESGINALENHGLDRCLDHGLNGFKRYISLAVLARNIQILGNFLQKSELRRKKEAEKRKYGIAA